MTWNKEADGAMRSHSAKIITAAGGGSHSTPAGNNAKMKPANFKNGGRVGYQDGGDVEEAMEGEAPMGRLDRPSRGAPKGKGATTVNVIIAPKPDAPPMPMPIPAGPPPGIGAPPPDGAGGPPPMPPSGPPPGMMGRKSGGRVMIDADGGAGSGPGRLEKIKDYGGKAGSPAKSPKGD